MAKDFFVLLWSVMAINRRNFLKSLAAAAALSVVPGVARASDGPTWRRITITVVRRECFADLQSLYLDDPETGPCSRFAIGDRFTADSPECPAGFCPKAWQTIMASLSRLSPGCAPCTSSDIIVACPDGTRPVIFKVNLSLSRQ